MDAGTILHADHVSKRFTTGVWPRRRTTHVLIDARIDLAPAEIVGLVGENGSGKSTFMRILVGALRADTGTIVRPARLGYCPQQAVVYARLTCNEHLALFGRAHGLTDAQITQRSRHLYEELGFERWANARVDQLSGGTLAKLNLAIALLPDPEVLLLDEPYAGFDWDTYLRFWDIVGKRRDDGRSVLIVSHFVADRERFDRVVAIENGRTVE